MSDDIDLFLKVFGGVFLCVAVVGLVLIAVTMFNGWGDPKTDLCEFRHWGICAGK